ncbi:PDC sensor domain-containing protein [Algoriphagus chordae]|uniref:Cache domain-containing protein n=1 Tax=Algoriphagus chordae TaxID=237019 RepID=A0A2W7R1T7_9BACT|nr:PDC sensor domain-containing protein [Algoriphagus chordae]PZX54793.1 hypothetical protein LV85_01131 [Algoriphagus chordae]
MKSSFLWIFPSLIVLLSCESSPKVGADHTKGFDKSIIVEMESELSVLEDEIVFLKDHFEFLLDNRDSLMSHVQIDKYSFNGGYSTNTPKDSDKLSSVVILNTTSDFDRAMENVLITNGMDSLFYQTAKKYKILSQVYFNTIDQMSRVFPAYDAKTLLEPDIDLASFNFFYEADTKHNPDQGPVWISEVYIDPAGRGWILSLVHPVLDNGELYAVLGIDITVDEIISRYLESREGDYLIVNGKGDIVGGNASAIEALSFPPLLNHVYEETIRSDNFRISDFNLFNSKNREVREMAQSIILKKENHFFFQDEFSPQAAYAIPFTLFDWYLIEVQPNSL